ncbi:MAG TPA: hypothetical protein VG321_07480 [Solirubrobacteraceae bacterium]|jgi:hypothetical protein|nr:hypothetical protein [Solirubrobacteraceae bacterium]
MLAGAVCLVGLLAAACGGTTNHNKSATSAQSAATHVVKSKPQSKPKASALSGKWSGQYSGAFNGTFSLNWTQAGSKLSGNIKLSQPAETTGISGSVSGGSINFGTVSGAVYNGTVSGSSMSGHYTTPRGGGSWSASKG